jgi:hypothetical protein
LARVLEILAALAFVVGLINLILGFARTSPDEPKASGEKYEKFFESLPLVERWWRRAVAFSTSAAGRTFTGVLFTSGIALVVIPQVLLDDPPSPSPGDTTSWRPPPDAGTTTPSPSSPPYVPPIGYDPPPSPPPALPVLVANATYTGSYGYNSPKGALCRANYPVYNINVSNGSISFIGGDFRWEGSINQRTGSIDIPNEGIRRTDNNALSKRGLAISGNYRNATLRSGFCGTGFFRINN